MATAAGPLRAKSLLVPFLLMLLAVAALRVPFAVEPLGRDQGLFFAQALEWLDGGRFYLDIWEHKPVGIILIYAGALSLFGSDPSSIQLAHALSGWTTACLLFALGRTRGLDTPACFAAALLYLVLLGGPAFGGFWSTAQVEIFVDPLVVSALILLTGHPRRRSTALAAGVALGLATFLLKTSCAPLFALVILLRWPSATTTSERDVLRKVGPFVLGAAGVAAGLMAIFFATGRLEDFWQASVEFNWAHRAVATPGQPLGWLEKLLPFSGPLRVLYLLSFVGLALRLREGPSWGTRDRLWLAALVLFCAALAQVFLQGKFWGYHYHVLLLPLSLLAALGFQALADGLRPRVGGPAAWSFCMLLTLALGSSQFVLLRDYAQQHRLPDYWRGAVSAQAVQRSYRWGGGDFAYADNLDAGARLAAASPSERTLFVWGFEPSLYWLGKREPVSRFFYDYPLSAVFAELARGFEDQLLADLEARPPATFIVVLNDENDLEELDSSQQLTRHPRIAGFLGRRYEPAWTVGDFRAYGLRSEPRTSP